MNSKRIAGAALAALLFAGGVAVSSPAQAKPSVPDAPAVVQPNEPAPPAVSPAYQAAHRLKGDNSSKAIAEKGLRTPKDGPASRPSTRTTHVPTGSLERLYGGGHQYTPVGTTGTSNFWRTGNAYLDPTDGHTLGETAVQSFDGQQVVEAGWRITTGSATPVLFVFSWVDGVGQGYGTGFVDNAANTTWDVGDNLTPNTTYRTVIRYISGNWWVWMEAGGVGDWLGHYPGSLWTGSTTDPFDQARLVQNFGEISATVHTPCTDMGYNGILGTAANTSAAYFSTFLIHDGTNYVNGDYTTTVEAVWQDHTALPSTAYDAELATGSSRQFYFGGPGFNSIGESTGGAANSCAPATAGTAPAATMQFWKEGPCPDGGTLGCTAGFGPTAGTTTLNLCTTVPAGFVTWGYKNNSGVSGRSYQMYRAAGGACTGATWGITNASQGLPPAGWGGSVITAFKRIG